MTERLEIGRVIESTRTLSQDDFDRFAALSGDDNPIHVDPQFAATTRFGRTVSHGMLLYGVLCAAVHENFPGATQLGQDLMFPSPTFAGEEITVRLEVTGAEPGTGQRTPGLRLAVVMTKANGETVCQGEALLTRRQAE
ncbi:MAG: MaoC family dehydratase [Trueperaceae bacterium]